MIIQKLKIWKNRENPQYRGDREDKEDIEILTGKSILDLRF
ncbi:MULTISPECIES: hypothetical protein [unclassified Microcoleus]